MNSKLHILALVAMMMLAGCSVHRDRERIETAEALLYCNRDSTELLIRQVERPERLDDAHLATYWFVTCDLHANSMQSLSEDSMICWAADYFRKQWEAEHGDAQHMILSGLDEAMYYWWNSDKEKTQEVLQRQKTYADEVAGEDDRAPKDGCKDSKKNEVYKSVDHHFVNFVHFFHFYLFALLLTPKDLFT